MNGEIEEYKCTLTLCRPEESRVHLLTRQLHDVQRAPNKPSTDLRVVPKDAAV